MSGPETWARDEFYDEGADDEDEDDPFCGCSDEWTEEELASARCGACGKWIDVADDDECMDWADEHTLLGRS